MQIECFQNCDIKSMTTFKIGGKVEKVFLPKTQEELVWLLTNLKDYILLGNCSNVLISSKGYKGNIILTTQMKSHSITDNRIIAECGVKGPLLSQKAAQAGLSGFEFMIGFPGTVGGEIYMNASAHGQSISDCLTRCCVFDTETKQVLYKEKSELDFSYRHSIFQSGKYILLAAEFELKKALSEEIRALMDRNIASRTNIQPNLTNPNAGSVFKNPPNDSAGRLLDKTGIKGLKGNNVRVWDNHANFIVNEGNATSEDVLDLMLKMYTAVKETYTIELYPEIIFIGDKTSKEEKICNILYKKTQK